LDSGSGSSKVFVRPSTDWPYPLPCQFQPWPAPACPLPPAHRLASHTRDWQHSSDPGFSPAPNFPHLPPNWTHQQSFPCQTPTTPSPPPSASAPPPLPTRCHHPIRPTLPLTPPTANFPPRAHSSHHPCPQQCLAIGQPASFSHRWIPLPPRNLGPCWIPPPTPSPCPLPPASLPTVLSLPKPSGQPPPTTLPTLIDLTGPTPWTTLFTQPQYPVHGVYHKVFQSLGSKHFPLRQPCFDPAHCL